ncbi:hypothetical protein QTP88_019205 [Uroleucon formosanum]
MKDKERISSVVNLEDPIDDTEEILQSNELTTETAFKEMKSPTTDENRRAWKTPQGMKRKSVPAETASSTLMKHLLNEEKKNEEVDEIDLFFDTMKRTVKKFSVADKLLVKRKIFNIVSDVEGKYVGEEQPQRQQSYGQNIQYKNHSLTSFPQTTHENVIFNLTPNTQQQFVSSQTSGPQINSYYDDTSNQSTSYSRPSSADSIHSYLNFVFMATKFSLEQLALIAICLDEEERENEEERQHLKRKRIWFHPSLLKRKTEGEFYTLLPHLIEDEKKFHGYFRMNTGTFEMILSRIQKDIQKEDTTFREAITPREKLVACLRYEN